MQIPSGIVEPAAPAKAAKAEPKPRGRPPKAKEMEDLQKPSGPPDTKKLVMIQHKINLYFQYFGDKLSFKAPKTLPKDFDSNDELLKRIQTELQGAGGIDFARSNFIVGVNAVEQLNTQFDPFGLRLSGPNVSLTQVMIANQQQWDALIVEFAIEHAEWFMVGPGKRLLAFVATAIRQVNASNHMRSQAASPDIAEAAARLPKTQPEQQ